MLRIVCIAFLFISVQMAFAQKNDTIRAKYIRSYHDKFFIWPVAKQRSLAFDISNPSQVGNSVRFKPNNAVGLGLGVYMFDLGLELVLAMPVEKERKSTYGNTKAQDIQLNILSKRWGADIFYQQYQGFYLSNPDSPLPASGAYPQRPDVKTENFGASGIYVFKPQKFSLRSSFTFADRQLKSGGSFLMSGTFNSFHLTSDSSILNPHYSTRIGLKNTITNFGYQTYSLAPGYAHNFIIQKFFVSLTLAIGPALHTLSYKDASDVRHATTALNTFADGRIAVGYSTDRFFTGVTYVNQSRTVKFDDVQFSSSTSTFRLLFGWRFREFGILKKSVWDLLPSKDKKA